MQVQPVSSNSVLSDPLDALRTLSVGGRVVIVLFAASWVAWFAPFDDLVDRSGTPLGGDYVMLYVAGQTLAESDAASLYDDAANQVRSSSLFPSMIADASWPYRYPPVTAWLMQPLSRLPFASSFAFFFVACVSCVVLAVSRLLRELTPESTDIRKLLLWSALGWPLVAEALIGGQSSPIALCLVVATAIALKDGRDILGGLFLGLCIYKPNLVGIVVIGTLVARPRAFWGMLAVAIPAGLVSVYVSGVDGLRRYVELASSLATADWNLETPFWKVHGLAPLIDVIIPGKGKLFAFLLGIPLAVWLGTRWRRAEGDRFWLVFAALLTANALFNPYVPIYDMLLLLPALLATGVWFVGKHSDHLSAAMPGLAALAGLAFAGPHISQALAPALGLQLFPLAVLGMLTVQLRQLRPAGPLV